MPKPNKSSASSGTRKKQAAKKVDKSGQPEQPGGKGGKQLTKAEKKALKNAPKQKIYVPPPKPPAPAIPDPLDAQGLARTLPAELVVVLRRLGKKDGVTRRKGLEEFKEGWTDVVVARQRNRTAETEMEEDGIEEALTEALPVWLHNLPSLLLSPGHRSLALSIHSSFLSIPPIAASLQNTLALGLFPGDHQCRDVISTWLTACVEETGRRQGGPSESPLGRFEDFVTWDPVDPESDSAGSSSKLPMVEQLGILVEYMEMAILRPHELHDEIHPAPKAFTEPSSGTATPKKGPKGSAIPTNFPSLNTASNKADEESAVEEESQKIERDSRYNLSGIVGLTYVLKNLPNSVEWPERLQNLLASAELWNLIRPVIPRKEVAASPPVRRALYGLLAILISRFESVVADKLLSVVGPAVLLSIWKETDQSVWGGTAVSEALIMLLTKFRNVWTLSTEMQAPEETAPEPTEEVRDDESDAESDDDEDEDEDAEDRAETDGEKVAAGGAVEEKQAPDTLGVKAYNQFLAYLQRGCNGCANEGYPTVLVILSTLPADVLPLSPDVYRRFFTSLWAAFDSKLLPSTPAGTGPSPMYQFLTAAIDCVVFLSVRAWRNGSDADKPEFQSITTEEIARVWSDGILTETARLTRMDRSMFAEKRLESTREAVALSKGVSRLAQESTELSNAAIEQICNGMRTTYGYSTATSADKSRAILIPRFTVLCEALTSGYQADQSMSTALDNLTVEVFRSAVKTIGDAEIDAGSRESYAKLLVRLLDTQGQLLHGAEHAEHSLHELMTDRLPEMLLKLDDNVVGPLCRDYVSWLPGSDAKLEAWQQISLVVDNLPAPRKFDVTQALLITWRNTQVPLRAEGTAWSHIVLEAAEHAGKRQDKEASAEKLVSAVILHADEVVDKETRDGLLLLTTTAITASVNQMLETGATEQSELSSLQSQLEVVQVIVQRRLTDFEHSDIHQGALVSLFELQSLGDLLEPSPSLEMINQLQSILEPLRKVTEGQAFRDRANARLIELLDDTAAHLDPAAIIGSLSSSQKSRALLPSTSELCKASNGHLQALLQKSLSASHPIVFDDLLPYETQENATGPTQYDLRGRSTYARRMEALVALLRSDRGIVRESADVVHQLLIMDRLLADELDCRGSSLGVYASDISHDYVQNIGAEFHDLVSYAVNTLASEAQASWHMDAITAFSRGTEASDRSVLTDVFFRIANASESDNLSPRVLKQLLARVLSLSGDVAITERWLACSQNLEIKKPMSTRAILHAVVPLLQRSPRLDRVRNDIASRLTAVPIAKAGSEGLRLLRNLLATAPSADSEDVFLPEQRTIFVMQHLTSWLTSTEEAADDLPEEVEARICLLFAEFLPIVQGRPGAHWNSVFDMITNNLEACSLADESTYNLASSTLHLLTRLLDLSATNKALAVEWVDRDLHARLILDLFVSLESDAGHGSSTKGRLIIQICDLLATMGNKTLDAGLTSRLYSMLDYDNLDVQRVAYRICREVVVRETADLVLEMETAIDAEDSTKTPLLPSTLLKAVASSQGVNLMSFGTLLSWMLLFDHFKDASASLRSAYSDQLRETGAVHDVLMAYMPDVLRQACSGTKSTDSVYFAVDEFHLELLEAKTDQTEIALSTHVFYRALENVPQLVRNWYEACKDRQLAMSFISVVTRHISPVLIEHEFAVIREPGVLKTLEDDSLTVRVLSASAEITARYTIDEQPMEIVIKLPQEYPLRNVEVKEVNRVGVTEGKWRGWMMNVQQLVMSRNGLLLEALKLFKSNVSLHFEGKTECSICYSIISMNDRSLPSRACPTCKNKYHANCLFTWFKSSNSSTCPMCRSLF